MRRREHWFFSGSHVAVSHAPASQSVSTEQHPGMSTVSHACVSGRHRWASQGGPSRTAQSASRSQQPSTGDSAHRPVSASHADVTHGPEASQRTVVPDWQTPSASQVSSPLQRSLSRHGAPASTGTFAQ
jgi:hypothetical protein